MFFRHRPRFHRQSLLLVLLAFVAPTPATGNPLLDGPVVFTSPEALAEFGIEVRTPASEDGGTSRGRFANLCYDYDRPGIFAGAPIAISDQLLARYRGRGFTLKTLCIALISQAQFNPETGARLPVYIVRNDPQSIAALDAGFAEMENDPDIVPKVFPSKAAFRTASADFRRGRYAHLPVEARAVLFGKNFFTNIQPLAVPDCFKNGTPYLDCNWRVGLMKGKPFSETASRKLREVGLAIDRQMKDAVASGKPLLRSKSGSPFLQPIGWKENLLEPLYEGQPASARIPQSLYDYDKSIAWFDISPDLPRGYAYSLHGWALDDPAASYESIEMATDENRESTKFDPKKLKALTEE